MVNIDDFNDIQKLILLAMYKLSGIKETILTSDIRNDIKDNLYILIDDNMFNRNVDKKRKGIELYKLSTSKIGLGGQKYHTINRKGIEAIFFPKYKIKATKMTKLIEKLEEVTQQKGYPLDGHESKDEIKSQKNLKRIILVVNSILNTSTEKEALRYQEFT